jgi:hypothetical protein
MGAPLLQSNMHTTENNFTANTATEEHRGINLPWDLISRLIPGGKIARLIDDVFLKLEGTSKRIIA